MKSSFSPLFFAFWAAPLAALALLLGGCAGTSTGGLPDLPAASATQRGITTASDETGQRRRARLRLELGAVYFEEGKISIALDEIKQSIAIDPNFADAYNLRGLVYMRLNDMALAEDSFRRALTLDPRDADAAHNYGWLLCQQSRFPDANRMFAQANAVPSYNGRAKTLMVQGLCQSRAGQPLEAERSLMQSYEMDAGNPVTGYNLSSLLYTRGEFSRAQFYLRRINNSEFANAETLWLGVKTERKLNNMETARQLGEQLRRRFGQSKQAFSFEKGQFND